MSYENLTHQSISLKQPVMPSKGYSYLQSKKLWETPIGNIVDQDYACISAQDSSHFTIVNQIPHHEI